VAGAAGRVLITPPSAVAARHVSDGRPPYAVSQYASELYADVFARCYVENAVQANLLAATTENAAALNQIYNVAVAERTTPFPGRYRQGAEAPRLHPYPPRTRRPRGSDGLVPAEPVAPGLIAGLRAA